MLANFAEVVENGSRDEALLAQIDWTRLPRHVAVIMDGNGRWAAQRGQPRVAGHRAGVEAVRASVDTGARLRLGALTLYAFSTENWTRLCECSSATFASSLNPSTDRTYASSPSAASRACATACDASCSAPSSV